MTPKGIDFSADIDNWTTQLRKGLLELCVMYLLAEGDIYGYDLVKRLSEVKGLVVTEGTIYPLLARLKRLGLVKTRLVESSNGPARKYYALTPAGRRMQGLMNAYWGELLQGVGRLQNGRRARND
jgi:PadR family transcriptional regulator, regulatory protein PadR